MTGRKKTKKLQTRTSLVKKVLTYCFFVILICLLFSFVVAGLTNAYFYSIIKDKDTLVNNKNTGLLLLDSKGEPFFSFYNGKRRRYVELPEISKHAQRAAIVAEDKEFYQHGGLSMRGIIRSIGLDFKEKSLAYGGSTITQQLVKNVLLTPEKSLIRKYQEAILAQQIERNYSKDEILEMYLNSIYFGEGSFGIEDAAQTYFGKNARDLTLSESSMLIGIIPAPSRFSPYNGDRDAAARRQKLLLEQMVEFGSITRDEMGQAIGEQLIFKNNNEDANSIAPHFALMVRDELIKKYGEEEIIRSGYTVKTTLETEWQEFAEVSIKHHVQRLSANQVTNAAVIAMDPKSGAIKSLVGSFDWSNEKNGKINMAISPRQPGSSIKPLIYAIGMEDRIITPATVLKDERVNFTDPNCPGCASYSPRNYDGKFRGNVLVRRALANSLNVPAVEVMQKVGVSRTLEKAKEIGVDSLDQDSTNYGLSLVLGGGEVSLIEMVQIYSSFANEGNVQEAKIYQEIKDKNGKTIETSSGEAKKVWSSQVAFLISSILSDRQTRNEVFGSALNTDRTTAVKTGTTDGYRDAWTIGYTPDLVVGVWVGNNDNTPMDQVAGSLGAAPLWRDMIEEFSRATPSKEFQKPPGVSQLAICRSNGLRAKDATGSTYMEYFISGTEPTRECREEPSPTGIFDNKEGEKELKEILEKMENDQQKLLEEIQKRRDERRGRSRNLFR
jgi:1A family penicillin-binding protein